MSDCVNSLKLNDRSRNRRVCAKCDALKKACPCPEISTMHRCGCSRAQCTHRTLVTKNGNVYLSPRDKLLHQPAYCDHGRDMGRFRRSRRSPAQSVSSTTRSQMPPPPRMKIPCSLGARKYVTIRLHSLVTRASCVTRPQPALDRKSVRSA